MSQETQFEEHGYEFTVTLGAIGSTPEEAWGYAVENFVQDPGSMPDDYTKDFDLCDECFSEIPIVNEGELTNKHHAESCSLYDAAKD